MASADLRSENDSVLPPPRRPTTPSPEAGAIPPLAGGELKRVTPLVRRP